MQFPPAQRKTRLFLLGATLLALVLGYRFFLSPSVPVATPAPRPVLSDTLVRSSPIDSVRSAPVVPVPKKTTPAGGRASLPVPVRQPEGKEPTPEVPQSVACDQLILRDGDIIDAHVTEVGTSEIRYKRCNRRDGPNYVVRKRDVLSIRYPNGSVDRFDP